MYVPNHVNASSAYWYATQCSRTGTKLRYELQDFCFLRGSFALDPEGLYLFLLLSSTMLLNPLASGSSFTSLTETFGLLQ